MERAVAAGDPPVSGKHPADEEWLVAQQNWLASHRTAARPLSKTQICRTARRARAARAASRARCAGRARPYVFVRPNATSNDLPSPSRDGRPGRRRHKPWHGTSSSSSSWIRRAPHAARAATAQSAHPDRARIAHAAHICSVQVLLARTHQCQQMPAAARPGTFDGSGRRRSRLSASRVSVAFRVSCTSRCLMNIRGVR